MARNPVPGLHDLRTFEIINQVLVTMEEDDIFPSFKVDTQGIFDVISANGYRKVLIQGPEGMKRGMMDLSDIIEERTGAEAWIDGEPCYGACDHAGERAMILGLDALIHLGHSDIPSMERDHSVPIHFFHVSMKIDEGSVTAIVDKIIPMLEGKKLSLFTTVQHLPLIGVIQKHLEGKGIDVHIGEPGGREEFAGQVLGCSFASASDLPPDMDDLIFIGTGEFHPMGLCLSTGKRVLILDPMTGEISSITRDDLDRKLRIRYAAIEKAKEEMNGGGTIGVIIGFKPGQRRLSLSEDLILQLRESGFKGRTVIMDHMDPMKLRTLGIDVAISTSCPRIALDDSYMYSKEGVTIITPQEARIALQIDRWDDYRFDEEW